MCYLTKFAITLCRKERTFQYFVSDDSNSPAELEHMKKFLHKQETKCEHFWQQWGWGAPLEWVDTKETTLTIHLQRILWNQWRPLEWVDIKEITLTIQLLRFFYNINEGLLNG